jgi:hypothetical protein
MSESVWIIEFKPKSEDNSWRIDASACPFKDHASALFIIGESQRTFQTLEFRAVEYVRKEEPKP